MEARTGKRFQKPESQILMNPEECVWFSPISLFQSANINNFFELQVSEMHETKSVSSVPSV
jgi:hypothetical protein